MVDNDTALHWNLSRLCPDIHLLISRHLDLDDLYNLSMVCKALYTSLCSVDVRRHWVERLPPAFLPIDGTNTIKDAIRRTMALRKALALSTEITPASTVVLPEAQWTLHVARTRWMFTVCSENLHCFDLATGQMVGSVILPSQVSPKLLGGQAQSNGSIVLAFPYMQKQNDEMTWKIEFMSVTFLQEQNDPVKTSFGSLKCITLPPAVSRQFTRFDMLLMEDQYVVLSGDWGSRKFIFIDWRLEHVVVQSFPQLWRTFSWEISDGRIIIICDSLEIKVINVRQALSMYDKESVLEPSTACTLSRYRSVHFAKGDYGQVSAIALCVPNNQAGLGIFQISSTLIQGQNDTVATSPGVHDGTLLDRCLANQHTSAIPLYIGSTLAFQIDDHHIALKSHQKRRNASEMRLGLTGLHLNAILAVDEDIGMIAVKEMDNIGRAQIRIYWVI